MNGNEKKDVQLGMSHGKASARLRKLLLFRLVQNAKEDVCYRCGIKILDVDDLSIEHKVPWLDSDDPPAMFFDLENVTFSHMSCNYSVARKSTKLTKLTEAERREHKKEYDRNYNRTVGKASRNRRHLAWQTRNPDKHNNNSKKWYWSRGREQRLVKKTQSQTVTTPP